MSTLQRFNEKTGRKEFYIKPNNLPGYWTSIGLCNRCYSYKKCLGLAKLSMEEWQKFENSPKKLLATVEPTSCCQNLLKSGI